jgi:hypothetical protein
MTTFLLILQYWDVGLLVVTVALGILAVIAKRTRNTIDDTIVEAAGEIVDVLRKVPVVKPAPAPAPAPATVPSPPSSPSPSKAPGAVRTAEKVEGALEQVGKIVEVVDKIAPTITAPAKQASVLVGALAGLAKVVFK